MANGKTVVSLNWSERQVMIARLALSQLSYSTGTGAERAEIAEMLADLHAGGDAGATAYLPGPANIRPGVPRSDDVMQR